MEMRGDVTFLKAYGDPHKIAGFICNLVFCINCSDVSFLKVLPSLGSTVCFFHVWS